MSPFLSAAFQFVTDHEGVLTLLGVAAVVNLPNPKRFQKAHLIYEWFYGTVQSFVSTIKPHVEPQERPTLPAEMPANPQP